MTSLLDYVGVPAYCRPKIKFLPVRRNIACANRYVGYLAQRVSRASVIQFKPVFCADAFFAAILTFLLLLPSPFSGTKPLIFLKELVFLFLFVFLFWYFFIVYLRVNFCFCFGLRVRTERLWYIATTLEQ